MKAVRICLILFVLSTVTVALAGVDVDYDRSINHRLFRTYAWKEGKPAKNPFIEEHIRKVVEEHLNATGLKKADGKADIYVATYASVEDGTVVTSTDIGYGAPGWRGHGQSVQTGGDTMNFPVGTLLVDLIDGKTNELCWRAKAYNIMVPENPEKGRKKVDKVVKKMFKDYPPEQMKK